MADTKEHSVEILWRMQQEAVAGAREGSETEKPRWGGLAFGIGELRLVTELTGVNDVLDCPVVTPLPGTQPWLRGVCNVRGNLYSVVDLGVYLNVALPLAAKEGRLLVVSNSELGCCLLVSKIFGLRYFIEEQQSQDIAVLDRAIQPYVTQAFLQDDELWGVLDLNLLLADERFLNIEGAVKTV